MSLFEFLMVLVSLIIGLGLAELLSGIALIIRNKQSVTLYWVHTLLVAVVFLALLQTWWEIWGVRETPSWNFFGLLMMLGGPVGLYLASHLVFPSQLIEADMRAFYYQNMRPVFIVALLTVIISTLFRPVILGEELVATHNASSFLFVLAFGVLYATPRPKVHASVVTVVFLAELADIFLINLNIQ